MLGFTVLDSFPEELSKLKNLEIIYICDSNKNILPEGLFDISGLKIVSPADYPNENLIIKESN